MRVFESHQQLEAALALLPLEPGAFRFASQFMPAGFRCADCREAKPFATPSLGTGYARNADNGLVCYECCGAADKAHMRQHGKIALYLTHDNISRNAQYPFADGKVTNWPGTLSIPCRVKRGHHNIARDRFDVWFNFDGFEWHGVQFGQNTQICHCKQTKTRAA